MRCILHIGTEKTGTTTIQNFLDINRKKLLDLGYLYTKSLGRVANRKLPVAVYNKFRRDEFTQFHKIYTDEDLLRYQNKIIQDLSIEISISSFLKVAVFSSEHIQSRLTTDNELLRLKLLLNGFGFNEIQILIYLRRPFDLANSLHSTFIKSGSIVASPSSPNSEYYRNICDHRRTLKRFTKVFGDKSIIPRIYGKSDIKDSSLISDFLISIGLDGEENNFVYPENKNQRLSHLGLELLRRINHEIPVFLEEKPNPLRSNLELVNYFSKYFTTEHNYTLMTEELFQNYELEFEESNEWVRNKYFPDREYLFPRIKYPGISRIFMNSDELDSVAKMISFIWLEKQKNNRI